MSRIRPEEGWVGIASVVWVTLISLYQVVQNRVVVWGKRKEEERLMGQTILLAVMAVAAVLFTATLILRAFNAGLEPRGERYLVNGDSYQVHLTCVGNKSENSNSPTILLEGGHSPVEHTLQPFIDDVSIIGDRSADTTIGIGQDSGGLITLPRLIPWGCRQIYLQRLWLFRNLLEARGIFMIDPLYEEYLGDLGRPGRGFLLWLRGIVGIHGLI
ncbi:Protein of unknown function DUF2417 [Penicillium coprophilum]|uniref:Protein of unknown function DUF2417 n=1 Tax=Penicillium coprophilum TaxID=36646 RepID=UPI0023964747|nr:Protein of unknown function DUF2417 [Penicillium coprophilum]KAJ5159112.1 Protein of unknown function DUF2417 [Penicillium coprophilum]